MLTRIAALNPVGDILWPPECSLSHRKDSPSTNGSSNLAGAIRNLAMVTEEGQRETSMLTWSNTQDSSRAGRNLSSTPSSREEVRLAPGPYKERMSDSRVLN